MNETQPPRTESNSSSNLQSTQNVECATYPIPQGLAQHIEAAVAHTTDAVLTTIPTIPKHYDVTLESVQDALGEVVGNSIVALDTLYFSQPPSVRQHDTFQHRLCIRVCADTVAKTLTITDLGIGMTRSDLINCLGIASTRAIPILSSSRTNLPGATDDEDDNDNDDDDSTDVSTDDDDDDDDDDDGGNEEEEDDDEMDDNGANSGNKEAVVSDDRSGGTRSTAADEEEVGDDFNDTNAMITDDVSSLRDTKTTAPPSPTYTEEVVSVCCTASAIGGFYSALCTLATAVTVSTKSKFDDYYEFRIAPLTPTGQEGTSIDALVSPCKYESFEIRRPYPEGTLLNVTTGQSRFEHVRGESGTSVCFQLHQSAIDAGLLNEQETLKPMFLRIVESTEYTVAFSTDTEQATEIIFASAVEDAYLAEQAAAAAATNTSDDVCETSDAVMSDLPTMDPMSIRTKKSVGGINRVMSQPVLSSLTTITDEDETPKISATPVLTPSGMKRVHSQPVFALDANADTVLERSKYIPVRLSIEERKMLRLVEAAMNCCDYTTQVDQDFSTSKKGRRMHEQLRGITSILNGLVTACDYEAGQKLLDDGNYAEFAPFLKQLFEIARRHKIMNPEKMRTEYGKLIYILQDAVSPSIQQQLGFSIKQPILSVYRFLEQRGGLGVLSDEHIETAAQEVLAGPGRTRTKIDEDIRLKERAVDHLKRKYRSSKLSSEDIHLCLYSICDNNSFLNSNRVPVDKVIKYLERYFSPTNIEDGYSLSIVSGTDGARLSHSHERQYYFALQSLALWRTIMDDMFRLWAMAEEDLLSNDVVVYSLQDTGQGMHRVQQSPRTYRAMQQILIKVQNQVSSWVGSSVIHLGDHNVPNALSFIDKYTQVPRILGPIITCLETVDQLFIKDHNVRNMIIAGFGGLEKLRQDILYDFFRSAFDGSGADNFYDAGSCIDGRLTSAWNWCSQLPDKPFYSIFKLTGFTGFDGEFV